MNGAAIVLLVGVALLAAASPASAVALEPHKLSACFHAALNSFQQALKAGMGLEGAAEQAQAVAANLCPDIDFEGLELSPEAVACKDGYLACIPTAKGEAACRKELLLCVAKTPEATAYKLETLTMNVKVDREEILKRGGDEVATKDAKGREIGFLTVKTKDGQVDEVKWKSNPIEVDFSQVDPAVGQAEVQIDIDMGATLPDEMALSIAPKKDDGLKSAVDKLGPTFTVEFGKRLKDVAYSVEIGAAVTLEVKGDVAAPPGAAAIQGATLDFKVNRAWADEHGTDNVRIFRQSDDGQVTTLPTTFVGHVGAQSLFQATTPGLSVFSLAAVEPVPAATPPAQQPGFEVLAALGALGAALVLLRRTRS